jgi:hypothetical protein
VFFSVSGISFRNKFKERAAFFYFSVPLFHWRCLSYLLIVFHGLFSRTARVLFAVRASDHFVSGSVFNGQAWELFSSHAWRLSNSEEISRSIENRYKIQPVVIHGSRPMGRVTMQLKNEQRVSLGAI